MAKVICTLPNTSGLINGVKFVPHKLGMVSEDVDDETAKAFTSIDGYHHHDPKTGGIRGSDGVPAAPPGPAGKGTPPPKPIPATPESLATAAATLSTEDHARLLDLLMDQEAKRQGKSSDAPAPATSAGGKSPAAPATSGSGAPPSKTTDAGKAAAGAGTPNPSF